jgi:hypothetical protein
MQQNKFWSAKINNREHIICSFVGSCVLQENLYEMKFFLYEMGFCVINLMQLRENKPRLRNITFFYKQNKVLYMPPPQLLLHQSPFYSQFARFLSSSSATFVLIVVDAPVTSLWQALHLQTLFCPAIGFDLTNSHKNKPQPAETKCFGSMVSKAEGELHHGSGKECAIYKSVEINDWTNGKFGKNMDSLEYSWNLNSRRDPFL